VLAKARQDPVKIEIAQQERVLKQQQQQQRAATNTEAMELSEEEEDIFALARKLPIIPYRLCEEAMPPRLCLNAHCNKTYRHDSTLSDDESLPNELATRARARLRKKRSKASHGDVSCIGRLAKLKRNARIRTCGRKRQGHTKRKKTRRRKEDEKEKERTQEEKKKQEPATSSLSDRQSTPPAKLPTKTRKRKAPNVDEERPTAFGLTSFFKRAR